MIDDRNFEQIWVCQNINNKRNVTDVLTDDRYLDYKIWCDINEELMYKKYLPNSVIFKGDNPNIIFHGGCLGCLSQRIHGIDRCMKCKYFRFGLNINNHLSNLYIKGEETLNRIINGNR